MGVYYHAIVFDQSLISDRFMTRTHFALNIKNNKGVDEMMMSGSRPVR